LLLGASRNSGDGAAETTSDEATGTAAESSETPAEALVTPSLPPAESQRDGTNQASAGSDLRASDGTGATARPSAAPSSEPAAEAASQPAPKPAATSKTGASSGAKPSEAKPSEKGVQPAKGRVIEGDKSKPAPSDAWDPSSFGTRR